MAARLSPGTCFFLVIFCYYYMFIRVVFSTTDVVSSFFVVCVRVSVCVFFLCIYLMILNVPDT